MRINIRTLLFFSALISSIHVNALSITSLSLAGGTFFSYQKIPPELVLANRINKKITYTEDLNNGSPRDYWSTPEETYQSRKGDCEDIALMKYETLISRGVPAEKLRLVYVLYGKYKQGHMVLVYKENENTKYILDNTTQNIHSTKRRFDLKPIFEIDIESDRVTLLHKNWNESENKLESASLYYPAFKYFLDRRRGRLI